MRKILFSLEGAFNFFPNYGECPVKLDTFAKLEGNYGLTHGKSFDGSGDMHPMELDESFKRDTRVLWSIQLRTRFSNAPGGLNDTYCLIIDDDDLFDEFDSENLQSLIDTKFETGELQDFLKSAKV